LHIRDHILFQMITLRCHLISLIIILLKHLLPGSEVSSNPKNKKLTQKDNIDIILDEQVICTMNGEIQWFLVCWVGRLNLDCTWITRNTL